jgi:hypothetical protein
MRANSVATFALSALVTSSVMQTDDAHAQTFWRTMSPFYCSAYNRDIQWGPTSPYDYTVANLSTTTDMAIACGVPNDNNLRHHDSTGNYTSSVWIVGTTTGNGITGASACVSYYGTTGGSCGNSTNITSSPFTYSLDTMIGAGSWRNTSDTDMPYVYMVLKPCTPSTGCTSYNTLRGYKVSGP